MWGGGDIFAFVSLVICLPLSFLFFPGQTFSDRCRRLGNTRRRTSVVGSSLCFYLLLIYLCIVAFPPWPERQLALISQFVADGASCLFLAFPSFHLVGVRVSVRWCVEPPLSAVRKGTLPNSFDFVFSNIFFSFRFSLQAEVPYSTS